MSSASKASSPFSRPLLTLFNAGTAVGLSDGELLQRFTSGSDDAAEMAFSVLVERHGAMVLRVCRSVTGDRSEAEDAFQSTFLILARKARSVRVGETLAPWLYGVARKVSARATASTQRRRRFIERFAEWSRGRGTTPSPPSDDSATTLIREELARLPHRYQAPVRLCDLDGFTQEEAAQLLKLPLGTIKSRLFRGRSKLRESLVRKGVTANWLCLVTPGISSTALPPNLAALAIRAALCESQGKLAAGALISSTVIALTEGSMQAMFMTKVKVAVCLALGAGVVAGGTLSRTGTGVVFGAFQEKAGSAKQGSDTTKPGTPVSVSETPAKSETISGSSAGEENFVLMFNAFLEDRMRAKSEVDKAVEDCYKDLESKVYTDKPKAEYEKQRERLDQLKQRQEKLGEEIKWTTRLIQVGLDSRTKAPAPQPQDPLSQSATTPFRTDGGVQAGNVQENETDKGEVAKALAGVNRAVDRLTWSNTMFNKGYVSKAQVTAEKRSLDQAVLALAQATDTWKTPETASKTPEALPTNPVAPKVVVAAKPQAASEELQHQIALAQKKLEAKEAALKRARAQEALADSVVAINERLEKRIPGSVSYEESNKAKAEVNVAKGSVEMAEAEFQASELELDWLKRLTAGDTSSKTPDRSEELEKKARLRLAEVRDGINFQQSRLIETKGALRRARTEAEEAKGRLARLVVSNPNQASGNEEIQNAKAEVEKAMVRVDTAEAELQGVQLEFDRLQAIYLKASDGTPEASPSPLPVTPDNNLEEQSSVFIDDRKHQLAINQSHLVAKKGALRQSEARLSQAQSILATYEKLKANQAISVEDLQKAKTEVEVAQGGVDIAQAELQESQLEVDRVEALLRKTIEGKPKTGPTSPSSPDQQGKMEKRIADLESKLDQALERLKSVAPSSSPAK